MTQQTLEFQDGESDFAGGKQVERGGQQADSEEDKKAADGSESDPAVEQQVKELMERIREQLSDNIKAGSLELEQLGQQIIIRIKENGSFPEGSAFLQPQFKPVIREVAQALKDIPGEITISGHTDNQPLVSEMYTSKWDLSAKRAVAVAEEMTTVDGFDQSRLVTMGYADTKPIVPNNSASNRALNRRVDIAIMQGKAKESDPVDVID